MVAAPAPPTWLCLRPMMHSLTDFDLDEYRTLLRATDHQALTYLPNMMMTPRRKTKAWKAGWLTGHAMVIQGMLFGPSEALKGMTTLQGGT